jgi:predicted aspartyl protease
MRLHSFGIVFVFALLLAPSIGVAAASDIPDATTLHARVLAAEGKRPERERVTQDYTSGGEAGKSIEYRDGKNSRFLDTYGPFHSEYGEYDGQAWRQNRNGETILEQPDPGKATSDKYGTNVTRVATPFDAYVVSNLDAEGHGSRMYVDPATYRVVRRDQITATSNRITTYDDFRTVDGYTRPWHRHLEDGFASNTSDVRVTATDSNVAPADLKIPGSRMFVEFPAGKTTVELPVTFTRDNKFLVRVTIAGRGLDFILDTGDAAGITINDDVAKQLGLKIYASHLNPNVAGRFTEAETIVPELSVGDLKMHNVAVSTIPDIGMEIPNQYRAVGLLGFDFIADIALKLDYEHGRVTAMTSDSFVPPDSASSVAIPIRIGSGSPQTDVLVNGALGERFTIDTGGAGGLMIFDYFARRHPEALVDLGGRPAQRISFSGVGGNFSTAPIQLKSVRLGKIDFTDFVAYRVTSRSYAYSEDGILGPEFLDYFTVYTDYQNSQIYLSRDGLGSAPAKTQK